MHTQSVAENKVLNL